MRATKPWVFLAHTLAQVGPPVFLLEFLRWMRENTPTEVAVVSLEGGSLRDAFAELGPVVVLGEPSPALHNRRGESLATAARDQARRLRVRQLGDPALVYVNTANSIRLRRYLPPSTAPVVAHAHELEVGLDFHLRPADRHEVFDATSHWVAASQAVADNLIAHHRVAPEAVTVHHEMIRIDDSPPLLSATDIRQQLAIPADAPIVGTAAVVDWRKAPDLFLELAWRMGRGSGPASDAHFVWVGGEADHRDVVRFRAEIDAAGLGERVHHVAAVARPLDWMRAFDVFVLPAREDAFPLACLEAASVERALVCFNSGGMPEFIEDDCGAVVRYPDVAGMATVVADLLGDPARRAAMGERGAVKVRGRHTVEVAAPRLYADLAQWAQP